MAEIPTEHHVRVARIGAWQAIAVAMISGAGAVVTTLIVKDRQEGPKVVQDRSPSPTIEPELQTKIAALEKNLSTISAERDALANVAKDQQERPKVVQNIAPSTATIEAGINTRIGTLEKNLATIKAERDALANSNRESLAEIDELKKQMRTRDRMSGNPASGFPSFTYFWLKLDSESPFDTIRCKEAAKESLTRTGLQNITSTPKYTVFANHASSVVFIGCIAETRTAIFVAAGPSLQLAEELSKRAMEDFKSHR